jgi:hypothetical protein
MNGAGNRPAEPKELCMSTFLFTYRTSQNNTAPSPEAIAAWGSWLQSMGPQLVDRGNPVLDRQTLGNCEADTRLGGYSLVNADSLEAAVALAQGCPALERGGGVEVGALSDVS